MRSLTFPSVPRSDKTFSIGLGAIVAFAVAEIVCAGFYYIGRTQGAHAAAGPATLPVAAPSAPPIALAIATPPAQTAPTPGATLPPSTAALSAADRLLKEATELRERGDTTNALARLQEAAEKEPKNAQVLAEMATIYESIQLFERSNETWRKVRDIGATAGPLYELAANKLKTGAPAGAAAGPGLAGVSPLDTGTSRPGTDGIPAGATLAITEVKATETPDPDADTNLMLRIAVKKRPNVVLDHTKVKIQVFFYDTVADKEIKLTDADVSYEWLTPNHDWANTNTETLAVTYIRPKNKALSSESALAAAAAAVNPGKKGKPIKTSPPAETGDRKYLGYIVRLYYNDQLQDKRAEPTKLLNLFPPPFTAPSQ